MRSADVGAAAGPWLPFVCPDDATAAVEFDARLIGRDGQPANTSPTEIVTVDGRRVERWLPGVAPHRVSTLARLAS